MLILGSLPIWNTKFYPDPLTMDPLYIIYTVPFTRERVPSSSVHPSSPHPWKALLLPLALKLPWVMELKKIIVTKEIVTKKGYRSST